MTDTRPLHVRVRELAQRYEYTAEMHSRRRSLSVTINKANALLAEAAERDAQTLHEAADRLEEMK